MRRSTAAAVGTLTGAALIVGVRLSVSVPAVVVAPPVVDLSDANQSAKPTKKPADKKKEPTQEPADDDGGAAASDTGLKDGIYKGKSANYAYGAIQVSIKISDGKITAADATYPVNGDSATINPNAIPRLNQATLKAQSADVDAVSGATLTSASYVKSLQAALDLAKG
jgi:uncharacterized protein with FMN-binding domain